MSTELLVLLISVPALIILALVVGFIRWERSTPRGLSLRRNHAGTVTSLVPELRLAPIQELPPAVIAPVPEAPDALCVGNPSAPLVLIERCEAPGLDDEEEVALTPQLKRTLASLLEHAPRLGVAAVQGLSAVQRNYSVIFSAEVQARLAAGTAELVGSSGSELFALARDPVSKQFVGVGRIVSGTTVNPIAVGAAVWQVAAFVTSQKFLADIDQKLGTIQEGVRRIEKWQENELFSQIEGDHRQLESIARSLQQGDTNAAERAGFGTTLGTIERDMRAAMAQLTRESSEVISRLDGKPWSAWLGSGLNENTDEASQSMKTYLGFCEAFLVAASVRLFAANLRPAVGLGQNRSKLLVEELEIELREFMKRNPEAMREAVHRKRSELKGTFVLQTTENAAKKAVTEAVEAVVVRVQGGGNQITSQVAVISERCSPSQSDALRLRVELGDDGQPVRVLKMRTNS